MTQNGNQARSTRFRSWLRITGILITLVALAFFIQRIWSVGNSNWDTLLSPTVFLLVFFGGIAHGFNCLFQGWAWQKLIVWFGESNASLKNCLVIYGRTQIAKYIPGNVFHFAGRHVAANQAGFHHPALVGAMVYEIIGLLTVGAIISLLGFPGGLKLGSSLVLRLVFLPLLILLPLMVQFVLVRFSIARRLGIPEKPIWSGYKELIPVWGLYFIFFFVDGLIVWALISGYAGVWNSMPLLYIISGYAISWVIGFITPGAPAGLGVRDAVMILFFSQFLGSTSATQITIISRLVVTLGDLVFFLLTYFINRRRDSA
jgi:hypothetical protein